MARIVSSEPSGEEPTIHAAMIWLGVALALALALPVPVAAQPAPGAAPAGVVTTLEGQALLARAATPAPVALKFRDPLFPRDRIETRRDTIVRVLLGGKAIVTIRELSVFTIREDPGRARVELSQGKAAVGVAKSLLRPGESVEIHTPNAVAAVRGSEVVAEVSVIGGVPQSTITALEVSAPVTVAPLANPAAAVTLGINQTVSVLGLGTAPTITPVRTLTPAQLAEAVRAAQAPKPREQSDRPPEGVARKVGEERSREAAQLSDAVTGGDASAVTGRAVSPAISAELDATAQTYQRTQDLLDVTSLRLDEIFEATGALIERAFSSEHLSPGFVIDTQTLALGAGDGIALGGTDRLAVNPVGGILHSQVTQTGAADLASVAPGSDVAIQGSLLFIGFDSLVSTEGSLFSIGSGATFASGFGGSALVAVQFGSLVASGGAVVAIGPGAHATFGRPLLFVDETSAVLAGTNPAAPAHVVDVGPGAQVRLEQALELLAVSGTLVVTGRVLSLGEGASLTIDTEAGGLTSIAFFPAVTGQPGATAVMGREMVALEPGARLTTNQPLVSILASDVTIGGGAASAAPADLLAVGRDAVLTISGTELISIGGGSAGPSAVTVSGNLLSLAERAQVVSASELSLPLLGLDASSVSVGADLVAVGPAAGLHVGPQSVLQVNRSTLLVAGSLLTVAPGAQVTLAETLTLPVLLLVDSAVFTGREMVAFAPDVAVGFARPLLLAFRTSLSAGGSLLALGPRSSLAVPDVTTDALLFVSGGAVSASADAVSLGAGARLDLNRPLVQTAGDAVFETTGGVVTVGPGAVLTSGGASGQFALIEFAGGPAHAVGPAIAVHPGARLLLDRPLLGSFGSDLTFPGGALRVHPGGAVDATANAEFFVGLSGGTHAIGTAPGASVFDLAGLATAVDPESGLSLGTDRPVRYPGSLLIGVDTTLTAGRAVRLDTALLEATAPLLELRRSAATTSSDVLDLSLRSKLSGIGPLVSLDGSTLTVLAGALANVAGGSFLKVAGDLLDLRNGSALRLLNGPVLSVTGNSAVSISGGLVAFNGTGGNSLSIANALCPCTILGGLPVALQNGATAANVSIGGNAIRNPTLGAVSFSSPNAAAIVVNGPASRVTIGGQ